MDTARLCPAEIFSFELPETLQLSRHRICELVGVRATVTGVDTNPWRC